MILSFTSTDVEKTWEISIWGRRVGGGGTEVYFGHVYNETEERTGAGEVD